MPDLAIYKLIISEKQAVKLNNFQLQPATLSLNAASRLLPKGVYTTLRTFEGKKILPLQQHLARLKVSAALLGHHIQINEQLIYHAIREAVEPIFPGDSRIRLTVSLENNPGELYLSIEPLKAPSNIDYQEGVVVETVPLYRENPEAKQTSFIEIAEQVRQILPPDAHEGLMVDEQGHILEGLSSNFFYIRDDTLWTAPQGVLSGITRSVVLAAAANENIPVNLVAASIMDIPTFEEAFITSSTRSVLPVRKIDHFIIGSGKAGPLTQVLAKAYWNEIKGRLVDL